MSLKISRTVIAIVLILSLGYIKAFEGNVVELFQKEHSEENTCSDQCVTDCHKNGGDNCFDECSCKSDFKPNNEQLLKMSQCYMDCNWECIRFDSQDKVDQCLKDCSCQCNSHCVEFCKSTGLDNVCSDVCGCHSSDSKVSEDDEEPAAPTPPAEASDAETQKGDEAVKEDPKEVGPSQEEKKVEENEDTHDEKTIETGEESHEATPTKEKDNETTEESHEAAPSDEESHEDTSAEHKDTESGEKSHEESVETVSVGEPSTTETTFALSKTDVQFGKLMDEMMEEAESCDPDCWRKCLQMKAEKKEVFTCIKSCGCGYESPQLLALRPDLFEKTETGSSGGYFAFGLLLVLMAATASIAYYLYKREKDNKLHEDLIYHDTEEGYEKLD